MTGVSRREGCVVRWTHWSVRRVLDNLVTYQRPEQWVGEMALDQLVLGFVAAPAQPGTATISPVIDDLFNVAVVVGIVAGITVWFRRRLRAWQIPQDEYRRRGLSILPLAFQGVKGNTSVDLHAHITNQHVNNHEAKRMIRVLMEDNLVQRKVDESTGAATYVLTDEGRRAIGRTPRASSPTRSRATPPTEAHNIYVVNGGDVITHGGIKQQGNQNQVHGWSVPAGTDFMEQVGRLAEALRADAARSPQSTGAQEARRHADDLDAAVKRNDRKTATDLVGKIKVWAGGGQSVLTFATTFLDVFFKK